MKAKRMAKRADRRVFKNTANKVHKQNIEEKYTRGGIRL